MENTEKEQAAAAVDMDELLARVENDRDLLRELIGMFKEDFPKQLASLRPAVEKGDAKRVASLAHTLKGMLANLAAHDAYEKAARLEQLGRNGQIERFDEAFATLEGEASKLLNKLEACTFEVSG